MLFGIINKEWWNLKKVLFIFLFDRNFEIRVQRKSVLRLAVRVPRHVLAQKSFQLA